MSLKQISKEKLKSRFTRGVSVFFLVATLAIGTGFPFVTEAQSVGGGVGGSMSGLGAVALGCSGVSSAISNGIKKIFGSSASFTTSKVPIYSSQVDDASCEAKIAHYIIRRALLKISQNTVNWINTGFKGNPLFDVNHKSFLQSIGEQEVSQFTNLIAYDHTKYPFGRMVTYQILNNVKNYFANNATYSLNRLIAQNNPGYNSSSFYKNFWVGGWDAFVAQTQIQANNPIGFSLLANDQLSYNLRGAGISTAQAVTDELNQAGGFLGLKVCVDPKGLDNAQATTNAASLAKQDQDEINGYQHEIDIDNQTIQMLQNGNGEFSAGDQANKDAIASLQKQIADLQSTIAFTQKDMAQYVCRRYETRTPGAVISRSLGDTLGLQTSQYLNSQDITDALGPVFDAFFNQMAQKGLTSLTNLDSGPQQGYTDLNGSALTGGPGENTTTSNSDNGGAYQQALNTAITNLPSQLPYIIFLQKKFLSDTNNPLPTGIDPATQLPYVDPTPDYLGAQQTIDALQQNITKLQALDYCIPGPTPGWQTAVEAKVQDTITAIDTARTDTDGKWYNQLVDALPVVGTAYDIISGKDSKPAESIASLKDQLSLYETEISKRYESNPSSLPDIAPQAFPQIERIGDYQTEITNIQSRIVEIQTGLRKLKQLQIDATAAQAALDLATNAPNPVQADIDAAQKAVDKLKDQFYRLAPGLMSVDGLIAATNDRDTFLSNIPFISDLIDQCWKQTLTDPVQVAQYKANGGTFARMPSMVWDDQTNKILNDALASGILKTGVGGTIYHDPSLMDNTKVLGNITVGANRCFQIDGTLGMYATPDPASNALADGNNIYNTWLHDFGGDDKYNYCTFVADKVFPNIAPNLNHNVGGAAGTQYGDNVPFWAFEKSYDIQ